MKKILLWNPYLDVSGGGEKHVLQICQFFIAHGYELSISWDKDIRRDLERKLTMALPADITWVPKLSSLSLIQKARLTSQYDILVYVTDGSYFFSQARKNIAFAMVPKESMYHMNALNRLKTRGWTWICNSRFTQTNLKKWGIHAKIIYPTIDIPHDRLPLAQPTKGTTLTFLTVGRFFRHLHSKRHDVAIAWFVSFIQQYPEFEHSKLVLVGGLKDEDRSYYESLKKLAQDHDNIVFRPNISRDELNKIYKFADFYVHFAGWNVKEYAHPERTEHLGITPLEAMAYGCIPLCFGSGGINEVITDGVNGHTFKTLDELTTKVISLSYHMAKQEEIRAAGVKTIVDTFSHAALDRAVEALGIL